MTTSKIEIISGVPTLTVNGKAVPQTAYITYIAAKKSEKFTQYNE
jgi:hypothetical protein